MAKKQARRKLRGILKQISALQERLFASRKHALLIVLQGSDTSGKDGVIENVATAFNLQGCRIARFGVPTPIEYAHDFLWRIHSQVPGLGEAVVFNRSQYEDVTTALLLGKITESQAASRLRRIVDFEESLVESGTIIIKFFLHISKEEQGWRLQDRFNSPDEQWKFNPGDLETRKQWDAYQALYGSVIGKTSKKGAPWYVVPADRKWYRDLAVATIILETLQGLDLTFPELPEELRGKTIVVE